MKQIRFVPGASKRREIVDISPKARRIDPKVVEAAFGAKPMGSSKGLDLFAIRKAMETMLQSSGGRPSLEKGSSQAKIPKIAGDWKKLERLVLASSNLKHKPSIGQMAATVLHVALGCIPENELKEAVRKELSRANAAPRRNARSVGAGD